MWARGGQNDLLNRSEGSKVKARFDENEEERHVEEEKDMLLCLRQISHHCLKVEPISCIIFWREEPEGTYRYVSMYYALDNHGS
jgi:hypothetical protein